jgi:hypothetical protein
VLLETVEAARQEIHLTEIAARAEIDAVRAEWEARLQQEQAANAPVANALAMARQELVAAREQVEARTASLEVGEARLQALEAACAELHHARDKAEEHLAAEIRRRAELAKALEDAQRVASAAQAETHACRDALETAAKHRCALEAALRTFETAAPGNRGDVAARNEAPLERVRRALQTIESVSTARDLLETLVGQLAQEFPRVALFLVRHNRLEGWRSHGFPPTIDIEHIVMPLTIASPLTRAVTDQAPATLAAGADGIRVGLIGGPVASAVALPVISTGRVVAVAYGEHSPAFPAGAANVGQQIAEILTEQVNRRLAARSWDPASDDREEFGHAGDAPAVEATLAYPGPARQAHRVKMREATEVLADGRKSLLVDLSRFGAQIITSSTTRPNQPVRMLLPCDEGAFPCKGRVVWACFELSPGEATPRYRAGLAFTEVDATAVEAFAVQHGLPDEAPHVPRPHSGTRPWAS